MPFQVEKPLEKALSGPAYVTYSLVNQWCCPGVQVFCMTGPGSSFIGSSPERSDQREGITLVQQQMFSRALKGAFHVSAMKSVWEGRISDWANRLLCKLWDSKGLIHSKFPHCRIFSRKEANAQEIQPQLAQYFRSYTAWNDWLNNLLIHFKHIWLSLKCLIKN